MHTKAPPPIESFTEPLSPYLASTITLLQLKQLYRQGWLARGVPPSQCESVAEHSYGVAMLALMIGRESAFEVDLEKLLQLALLHDVGEVVAGDITPGDDVAADEKARRERQGVEAVAEKLPRGDELISLWEEYAAGTSREARLVRELDRLEMAIQAIVFRRSEGTDIDEFLASADSEIVSPPLRAIFGEVCRLATDGANRN